MQVVAHAQMGTHRGYPGGIHRAGRRTYSRRSSSKTSRPRSSPRSSTQFAKFYEEHCLLEQAFIKDESVKIKDLITASIAKLARTSWFGGSARLEVGGLRDDERASLPSHLAQAERARLWPARTVSGLTPRGRQSRRPDPKLRELGVEVPWSSAGKHVARDRWAGPWHGRATADHMGPCWRRYECVGAGRCACAAPGSIRGHDRHSP